MKKEPDLSPQQSDLKLMSDDKKENEIYNFIFFPAIS